jgi:CobQ-like glutamine amidotransferase family enzyme|tara:strand:- start:3291 stop:3608 length:318 start_codon:yes stop_codon:yes gene_type:complete
MNPFMVVKVGAVDIDVFSLPFDGEAFGDFNYLNMRIRVDENLKGTVLVDTVLHELNHAIWAIGNLKSEKEEEERVVAVMASYWTQILRDNPHLVKWIIKNIKTKK